ncbi:actin [Acrasis kona]|uniref:Actin n=1 Tax=Acrasis kona TaxID=1008807 RepID=A0AAW2Z0W2_9EUKA
MDNCFVKSDDERSIFTMIIYLNDNYEGGNTVFYNRPTDGVLPYSGELELSYPHPIVPTKGGVLIFNHDVLHEGLKITKGTKYIIRCEIMFRRVSKSGSILPYQISQPLHLTSVLYSNSDRLENSGDLVNSTRVYLQALNIQVNHSQSIPDLDENHIEMLPNEILLNIFGFLDFLTVVNPCSLVCRRWNYFALESSVWDAFCLQHSFPLDGITNGYHLFRSLYSDENRRRFPIFVIGNNKICYDLNGYLNPRYTRSSVFKSTPFVGHAGSHCESFVLGEDAHHYMNNKPIKRVTDPFKSIMVSPNCIEVMEQQLNGYRVETGLVIGEFTKDPYFFRAYSFDDSQHILVNKVDMAIQGSKIETGLFVHVGGYLTTIVAVMNGEIMSRSRITSSIGPSYFADELHCKKLSTQTKLLQQLFRVAFDYKQQAEKYKHMDPHELRLDDQDFRIRPIDCIRGPEWMFNSGLLKLKENKLHERIDIPTAIRSCLEKMPEDEWPLLVSNVVTSGGGSMLFGFADRLHKEVASIVPDEMKGVVKVVSSPDRDQYVWRGASLQTRPMGVYY